MTRWYFFCTICGSSILIQTTNLAAGVFCIGHKQPQRMWCCGSEDVGEASMKNAIDKFAKDKTV